MPDRLTELVLSVTAPEGPRLYRDHYGLASGTPALRLTSLEGWRALPLLTKKTLLETPFVERTFVAHRDIDSYYASSGTTGSLPLFGPRACVSGPLYRTAFHDLARPALSSMLLPHMAEQVLREEGGSGRVVALDPRHMRASVALARAVGVDTILAHSFLMPALCEELERAHIADSIRYVEIAGEPCTEAQYAHIRRALPNAIVTPVYGAREVEGPIGLPCRPLGGTPLEVYHPNPDFYLEIIDEQGRVLPPQQGVEGELLVTAWSGQRFATPLLRYRIGDMVRVEETACPTHRVWSFSILGRTHTDYVKIPGGMLRSEEIIRALKACGAPHAEEFQIEIQEHSAQQRARMHTTLRCTLPPDVDTEAWLTTLARTLRVAPSYTYADGIRDGHYAELTHEPLTESALGKRKRIIRKVSQ